MSIKSDIILSLSYGWSMLLVWSLYDVSGVVAWRVLVLTGSSLNERLYVRLDAVCLLGMFVRFWDVFVRLACPLFITL